MDGDWTLLEYRPGRYVKVTPDGQVLGKASEAEVLAWFAARRRSPAPDAQPGTPSGGQDTGATVRVISAPSGVEIWGKPRAARRATETDTPSESPAPPATAPPARPEPLADAGPASSSARGMRGPPEAPELPALTPRTPDRDAEHAAPEPAAEATQLEPGPQDHPALSPLEPEDWLPELEIEPAGPVILFEPRPELPHLRSAEPPLGKHRTADDRLLRTAPDLSPSITERAAIGLDLAPAESSQLMMVGLEDADRLGTPDVEVPTPGEDLELEEEEPDLGQTVGDSQEPPVAWMAPAEDSPISDEVEQGDGGGDRWLWLDPRGEPGYSSQTFDLSRFLAEATGRFRAKEWTRGQDPGRLMVHPQALGDHLEKAAEEFGLTVVADPRAALGTYLLGPREDQRLDSTEPARLK